MKRTNAFLKDSQHYLSAQELAKFLGWSVQSIYRMAKKGKISKYGAFLKPLVFHRETVLRELGLK